jgi:5-oxoprolinase (ATP-hydrolysing)
MADLWEFWIDRGGTFTDVVARQPGGAIVARKLLSENPQRYEDAAIQGIRDSMGLGVHEEIPVDRIAAIKMGTTVATNALLERKGDRTLLLITKGFGDALRIGYQYRPKIFDLHIVLPDMLYDRVLEIEERIDARGNILKSLEISAGLVADLRSAYNSGIRACAIVLLHGYRYPQHELALAAVAKQVGFTKKMGLKPRPSRATFQKSQR